MTTFVVLERDHSTPSNLLGFLVFYLKPSKFGSLEALAGLHPSLTYNLGLPGLKMGEIQLRLTKRVCRLLKFSNILLTYIWLGYWGVGTYIIH